MWLVTYIKTRETKEVYQSMNEEHTYSEDGVEWKRIFVAPQARVNSFSNLNPHDYQAFNNWIDNGQGGTVGDLWDASKELSEKRKSQLGKDPIKDAALKDYSKVRQGTPHPFAKDD